MSRTVREMEETILAHLQSQKGPSKAARRCMYRGPGGKKCAVGCLISDEFYSSDFEGRSSWCSAVASAVKASGWPYDAYVLHRWQVRHDNPENWGAAGNYIGPTDFVYED